MLNARDVLWVCGGQRCCDMVGQHHNAPQNAIPACGRQLQTVATPNNNSNNLSFYSFLNNFYLDLTITEVLLLIVQLVFEAAFS